MIIGLSGSNGVGKTTLAKAYAEKHGIQFLETNASAVFKKLGFDPAITHPFADRLTIQEAILDSFEGIYQTANIRTGAITDRTPLDLIAYTMADAVADTVPEDQQLRFAKYVSRCFEVLNNYFASVVVVPPGLPMVAREGKAAANIAYIEHLHTLFRGLMVDERCNVQCYRIDRLTLDLKERISAVKWCVNKALTVASEDLASFREAGRKPN